jgi:hypothetical protein
MALWSHAFALAGPFLSHVPSGQPPQFLVYRRHQLVERGFVAVAPSDEQLGHFFWRGRCHRFLILHFFVLAV